MKITLATSLALVALCASGVSLAEEVPAAEPPAANIGHLTCTFGDEVERETISGSARSIMCVFRSLTNNIEELYVGTAYLTAALDASETGNAISWIVKAKEGSTPSSLEQTYTAQANTEAGDGAAVTLVAGKSASSSPVELHAIPELSGEKKPAESGKVAVIELKLKTTTT
jgi:hypothetical protein